MLSMGTTAETGEIDDEVPEHGKRAGGSRLGTLGARTGI